MLLLPNITTAFEQLRSNRLRSLLTVLGIVIAVASTITVVSVVQGFTRYVADFLQGLGTNAMWVWPERPPGEEGKRLGRIELDEADIEAIAQQCEVLRADLAANPPRWGQDHARPRRSLDVDGGGRVEYHAIRNFAGRGRPAVRDHRRRAGASGLRRGARGPQEAEVDDDIVGQTILLGGRRFRVIGILEEKGSFLGNSQDDIVLVPYTMALKMYPRSRRLIAITAQAESEEAVPEARARSSTFCAAGTGSTPTSPTTSRSAPRTRSSKRSTA